MTELKTLKDLEEREYSLREEDKELVNAVFFDLKAEAIKWIKEWLKYRKVDKKEFFKVMEYALKHTGKNWKDFCFDASKSPNEDIIYEFDMVEMPIRFFNITEEDLTREKLTGDKK